MNLSENLDDQLWSAVQATYEAENYSGAILESILYLTELIRNKSGLDSDGNQLVGSAFGGQSPIVKINALYTDSEKDEQRGIEQLLRGIYTGIRNPRSHDKKADTVETADAIISFVGWICRCLDNSKSKYDVDGILSAIFDQHFAKNERYASLLVERIPRRKRLDVLVSAFQRRLEGSSENLSFFAQATLGTLSPEEQDQFWLVVSDVLEGASEDSEFRSAVQIAEKSWIRISEIARIRVEHRLIKSIKDGEI